MIHVIKTPYWKWEEEPCRGYRTGFDSPEHKFGGQFLPVNYVVPVLEVGDDFNRMKLPDGEFRVVKTRSNGRVKIVSGEENTGRCLLFADFHAGYYSRVSVLYCNGIFLKECVTEHRIRPYAVAAAILNVGQSLVFHSSRKKSGRCLCVHMGRCGSRYEHLLKRRVGLRIPVRLGG